MKNLSAPGAPFQYAWHVPNLEDAAKYWSEQLGIGPFFLSEVDSSQYDGFKYRGGEGILRMRLAWAQSKEGQIELIEVNSKEPNVYHDLVAPEKPLFITLESGQMITMRTRRSYLQIMRSQWTWEKIPIFVTLIQRQCRAT